MFWIPLTLSAVFICIFSPNTYGLSLTGLDYEDSLSADAALGRAFRSAYAAEAGLWRGARNALTMHPEFGLAQINYYREDAICSGVHLKPWIIMTTGDCVHGREVKKLFALVVKEGGPFEGIRVQVQKVLFNPKYKHGDRMNNMALLIIYSQFDWKVGSFVMPEEDYSIDHVLKKNSSMVYEWWHVDVRAQPVKALVTKDFGMCGALGDAEGWYCTYKPGKDHTYYNSDRGLPFLLKKSGKKVLLGMYTGVKQSEKAPGHLFQKVYPAVYWVEEVIHEHPVPPEF